MEYIYEEIREKYPRLDLSNRMGASDYIDFIQPEELTSPIMRGIDCLNRRFICIRIVLSNGNKVSTTFFRRYPNNPIYWVSARLTNDTLDREPFMNSSNGGVDENQVQFLNRIISGEEIKLDQNMYEKYRLNLPLKGNFDVTIKLDQ